VYREYYSGEIEDVSPPPSHSSNKPGLHRKVSGLFVFEVAAPLAEQAYAPVLETGLSEFESRVGHQIFAVTAPDCSLSDRAARNDL
jgi:hypothetical protein